MAIENIVGIASGVGVTIGLTIHFMRQRKQADAMQPKILRELAGADSLTLPELVVKMGMTDGFMNRGKLINILNPMVASGQILQEEPPGTTMKNRLSVLRFRLPKA
jgi:hypothetical protein